METATMKQPTVNPLMAGLERSREVAPCTLVIFGASGDLTKRKLIGAIYNLAVDGLLPDKFAVVGAGRKEKSDEQFAREMREAVDEHSRRKPVDDRIWGKLAQNLYYQQGGYDDVESFTTLRDRLATIDKETGTQSNHLFYLATPPSQFPKIAKTLAAAGLISPVSDRSRWTRVIFEKPFGHDLDSARQLDDTIHSVLDESQIYRIDHYLGKETVQNIMVFRLGNGFFEPLWNSRYVDNVQITVAESVGVEGRTSYYEQSGVVRDMVQSHILQLLTLLAMEPPSMLTADAVRDEKVKVLRALRPYEAEDARRWTVRGQYDRGWIGGAEVPGYRELDGVADQSMTPTYVALRTHIDNWRWAGTPFYIRVGKRLPKRLTEVAITFKAPPLALFGHAGMSHTGPNVLGIKIQPDEGIYLAFSAKAPGMKMHLDSVRMDFHYATSFGVSSPEAYERLILDAFSGDATLFARTDEVDLSWRWVDQLLRCWDTDACVPLARYAAGSDGPEEAAQMLRRDGRRWRSL
ncbi:MAG: glucose-6-phosphate dehydrogenase [Candidatus Zixiibacteriota bacterium]